MALILRLRELVNNMSKMIPSYIDSDTLSPGEIDFFKRISKDQGASDWVVLHSLNIAHHQTRLMGEIDFLVIVPKKGILAVEIKAHSFIKVNEGKWYMGRKDKKGTRKTPFNQVDESMFSLKEYISRNNQNLKGLPIFSLVIFTHFNFNYKSIEWKSKDYVGSKEYRSKPVSILIKDRIDSFIKEALEKKSSHWLKAVGKRPSSIDIKQLLELIRPSIELSAKALNPSNLIENELIKYTSEQFLALDTLAGNERVLFDGSAGTGKTVLAIESAVRESSAGKKVLFICMNKLLNEKLEKTVADKNIDVLTLHKFLRNNSKLGCKIEGSKYWDEELPEDAYCHILENENSVRKYDVLIIDEAQDILRNDLWLDCLDLILEHGLAGGRWLAFGDFNLQTIYSFYDGDKNVKSKLLERSSSVTEASLYRNCRNVEDCSRLSLLLADMDSPYHSYLRENESIVKSSYFFYTDDESQFQNLLQLISKGLSSGFKPNDIVILSKSSELKSISSTFNKKLNISPFSLECKGVSFTSIHKFKGLEAPYVILTDFEELESEESRKILFTGASRATDSVHYLFAESARLSFLKLLVEGKSND